MFPKVQHAVFQKTKLQVVMQLYKQLKIAAALVD